jgi:hypothetical protein
MAIAAAPFFPWLLTLIPLGLAAIVAWNLDFYRFLARVRGWFFAARVVPLHYIYYCCCGLSVVIAMVIWNAPSQRKQRAEALDDGLRKPPTGGNAVPAPNGKRAGKPSRWTKG